MKVGDDTAAHNSNTWVLLQMQGRENPITARKLEESWKMQREREKLSGKRISWGTNWGIADPLSPPGIIQGSGSRLPRSEERKRLIYIVIIGLTHITYCTGERYIRKKKGSLTAEYCTSCKKTPPNNPRFPPVTAPSCAQPHSLSLSNTQFPFTYLLLILSNLYHHHSAHISICRIISQLKFSFFD